MPKHVPPVGIKRSSGFCNMLFFLAIKSVQTSTETPQGTPEALVLLDCGKLTKASNKLQCVGSWQCKSDTLENIQSMEWQL